ncbi:MAG: Hpt domain-containing protein [Ignavibacteriota bacterium]
MSRVCGDRAGGHAELAGGAGSQAVHRGSEARAAVLVDRAGPPNSSPISSWKSREHLQAIEQNLLAVEQNPESTEPIHAIFRAFHTIKGIAGFLELNDVREVSHETETLLDHARNGDLKLTAPVIDVILAAADYLNREVTRIAAGEAEPAGPSRWPPGCRPRRRGPQPEGRSDTRFAGAFRRRRGFPRRACNGTESRRAQSAGGSSAGRGIQTGHRSCRSVETHREGDGHSD